MSKSPEQLAWRDLYRDALLEPDPIKAHPRIETAYDVIGARVRELQANSVQTEEIRELNIALYFLSLLRYIGEAEREEFKSRLSDANGFKIN